MKNNAFDLLGEVVMIWVVKYCGYMDLSFSGRVNADPSKFVELAKTYISSGNKDDKIALLFGILEYSSKNHRKPPDFLDDLEPKLTSELDSIGQNEDYLKELLELYKRVHLSDLVSNIVACLLMKIVVSWSGNTKRPNWAMKSYYCRILKTLASHPNAFPNDLFESFTVACMANMEYLCKYRCVDREIHNKICFENLCIMNHFGMSVSSFVDKLEGDLSKLCKNFFESEDHSQVMFSLHIIRYRSLDFPYNDEQRNKILRALGHFFINGDLKHSMMHDWLYALPHIVSGASTGMIKSVANCFQAITVTLMSRIEDESCITGEYSDLLTFVISYTIEIFHNDKETVERSNELINYYIEWCATPYLRGNIPKLFLDGCFSRPVEKTYTESQDKCLKKLSNTCVSALVGSQNFDGAISIFSKIDCTLLRWSDLSPENQDGILHMLAKYLDYSVNINTLARLLLCLARIRFQDKDLIDNVNDCLWENLDSERLDPERLDPEIRKRIDNPIAQALTWLNTYGVYEDIDIERWNILKPYITLSSSQLQNDVVTVCKYLEYGEVLQEKEMGVGGCITVDIYIKGSPNIYLEVDGPDHLNVMGRANARTQLKRDLVCKMIEKENGEFLTMNYKDLGNRLAPNISGWLDQNMPQLIEGDSQEEQSSGKSHFGMKL